MFYPWYCAVIDLMAGILSEKMIKKTNYLQKKTREPSRLAKVINHFYMFVYPHCVFGFIVIVSFSRQRVRLYECVYSGTI